MKRVTVIFLGLGYREFIDKSGLREVGPLSWRLSNGMAAAVICKVEALEYGNSPDSGDSCCKMILKFVDRGSAAFSRKFKLSLVPNFILENALNKLPSILARLELSINENQNYYGHLNEAAQKLDISHR
ncbi:hypothetical protein MLD38_040606 [Melastoma candidum]|nr:hypothetical protein MLD38_040606 [Melastoma candidum]